MSDLPPPTAKPEASSESTTVVAIPALHDCLAAALRQLDVPAAHAERIAEVLLDAELRGYDDHGAFFLGELAAWYQSGALNPSPQVGG